MKRHMLTHTADNAKDKGRLYPCPFCGIELASKSDVRSHVAKEHEQKNKDKAVEKAAGQEEPGPIVIFPETGNTAGPQEGGENANVKKPAAPKSTASSGNAPAKDKDYQCETCGKTFCQASSLKAHQLVHSGLKPHACTECSARFRKTHHLRRHMLVHTGERPYGCDLCDRTFTSSGNLNKHRAIHLGEKNFHCDMCDKKFTQVIFILSEPGIKIILNSLSFLFFLLFFAVLELDQTPRHPLASAAEIGRCGSHCRSGCPQRPRTQKGRRYCRRFTAGNGGRRSVRNPARNPAGRRRGRWYNYNFLLVCCKPFGNIFNFCWMINRGSSRGVAHY